MSAVDRKIRELIGDMTINLLAAQTEIEKTSAQRDAAYEMLNSCILSGQVPANEVPKMLDSNPDFAAWHAGKWEGQS